MRCFMGCLKLQNFQLHSSALPVLIPPPPLPPPPVPDVVRLAVRAIVNLSLMQCDSFRRAKPVNGFTQRIQLISAVVSRFGRALEHRLQLLNAE